MRTSPPKTSIGPLLQAANDCKLADIETILLSGDYSSDDLRNALRLARNEDRATIVAPLLLATLESAAEPSTKVAFTDEFLPYAKYKEVVLRYVINNKKSIESIVEGLADILNETTRIGLYFRIQRGFFECKRGHGTLNDAEKELRRIYDDANKQKNVNLLLVFSIVGYPDNSKRESVEMDLRPMKRMGL